MIFHTMMCASSTPYSVPWNVSSGPVMRKSRVRRVLITHNSLLVHLGGKSGIISRLNGCCNVLSVRLSTCTVIGRSSGINVPLVAAGRMPRYSAHIKDDDSCGKLHKLSTRVTLLGSAYITICNVSIHYWLWTTKLTTLSHKHNFTLFKKNQ